LGQGCGTKVFEEAKRPLKAYGVVRNKTMVMADTSPKEFEAHDLDIKSLCNIGGLSI